MHFNLVPTGKNSCRPSAEVIDVNQHVAMEAAQLAMLLDGIDLNARRLARWNPESNKGIDTDP